MFTKSTWHKSERKLLDLLFEGTDELLSGLKKQTSPPFFSKVVRRNTSKVNNSGKDHPLNEYRLDIIFDESLITDYTVGDGVNLQINDLTILDNRIDAEINITAFVRNGVLTDIVATTHGDLRWPKYLRVDDWWFILDTPEGQWRGKRRESIRKLDESTSAEDPNDDTAILENTDQNPIPASQDNSDECDDEGNEQLSSYNPDASEISAAIGDLAGVANDEPHEDQARKTSIDWVMEFLVSSFDSGEGVTLSSAASDKEIARLLNLSPEPLPQDFVEFYTTADGGEMWGNTLLGCDDIAGLDIEDSPENMLVFALAVDGGSYALNLGAGSIDENPSTCPVVRLKRKSDETAPASDSFKGWLKYIETKASATFL